MNQFRLGIVGGMGPLAGVELQKLIIEATPARSDQEHLQVVCFTNPQIPDRTQSLLGEGEASYVAEVNKSIKTLQEAGATHIVMACHTAHARIGDIRRAATVPVLDLIEVTLDNAGLEEGSRIGLLATRGTLKTGVYASYPNGGFEWVFPTAAEEDELMKIIYRIKAGENKNVVDGIERAVVSLLSRGAKTVILGCTELSLYFDELLKNKRLPVIDPLHIMAQYVVRISFGIKVEGDTVMRAG